jgi:hypothetical protein
MFSPKNDALKQGVRGSTTEGVQHQTELAYAGDDFTAIFTRALHCKLQPLFFVQIVRALEPSSTATPPTNA